MPLTEAEESRLQKYIEELNIPPEQQGRIRTIAEMSKDGETFEDIKAAVGGRREIVYRRRSQLRRRQVY